MKNAVTTFGTFRKCATAALLACAVSVSSLPAAVSASSAGYDQKVLFYDYAAYELLPEFGYASREDSSMSINYQQLWSDGNLRCWDNDRQGLVSARCIDLQGDGIPEMAVSYLTRDDGSDLEDGATAMYVLICTMNDNWDGVKPVNTNVVFSDSQIGFRQITGGLMEVDGEYLLLVEDISSAYFADGSSARYTFYRYGDMGLQEYAAIGPVSEGTSAIAYQLSYNDGDSTLLYADPDYLSVYGGMPLTDESIGRAVEEGFALMGLGTPDHVYYDDADFTLYPDTENTFPTFSTTDAETMLFEYTCSGPGDWENRDLTVSLKDHTNLKSHMDRRDVDITPYINNPASDVEIDMTEGQIFPDSSERLLTGDDIRGKSWDDLRLGINEIYARYGYTFKTASILSYFRQFAWYEEIYDNQNDVYALMNSIERKNVSYLNQYVDISSSQNVDNTLPENYIEDVDGQDVIG